MKYRGFTYGEEILEEDDCRKIWHEVIDPQGRRVDFNEVPADYRRISPYRSATQEEFEQAVDQIIFHRFALGLGVDLFG